MIHRTVRMAGMLLVAAPLSAWADSPPAEPAPAAMQAPAASATPAAAAAAASPPPAATTAAADRTLRELTSGYRRVERNGQVLYCRKETTVGTRFAKTTCLTLEGLKQSAARTDADRGQLEKAQRQTGLPSS